MKIKEVSEKLFLQNRRAPNPEGSKFFSNSEESQSGGVLFSQNRRGLNFADPEGTYFWQSVWVLFLSTRRGIILFKDLGKQKKR